MIEDGGELCRARLDAARESLAVEKLSRLPGEFPVIDSRVAGARHRKLWYVRDDACGHALHVVDVDSGAEHSFAFDDSERPAEALFVPRSDRLDDGWLVTIVFDARCGLSYAAVFDATRPDHGPLGRAWFNHHVPVTFHGTWIGSAS
jgi:carotenoid cleavage dioxygenase-like enzyme